MTYLIITLLYWFIVLLIGTVVLMLILPLYWIEEFIKWVGRVATIKHPFRRSVHPPVILLDNKTIKQ